MKDNIIREQCVYKTNENVKHTINATTLTAIIQQYQHKLNTIKDSYKTAPVILQF